MLTVDVSAHIQNNLLPKRVDVFMPIDAKDAAAAIGISCGKVIVGSYYSFTNPVEVRGEMQCMDDTADTQPVWSLCCPESDALRVPLYLYQFNKFSPEKLIGFGAQLSRHFPLSPKPITTLFLVTSEVLRFPGDNDVAYVYVGFAARTP